MPIALKTTCTKKKRFMSVDCCIRTRTLSSANTNLDILCESAFHQHKLSESGPTESQYKTALRMHFIRLPGTLVRRQDKYSMRFRLSSHLFWHRI